MTWRISINFIDQSVRLNLTTTAVCATAIRSSKGPTEPYTFYAGQTQNILDAFGYPSADYPDIQDVIDLNQNFIVKVTAPAGTGSSYGGVFVNQSGTLPFSSGLDTQEVLDFSAISQTGVVGEGDGAETDFTFSYDGLAHYVDGSLVLSVADADIVLTYVDTATGQTFTGTGVAGEINRTTKLVTLTFTSFVPLGDEIVIGFDLDFSTECYFILYSAYEQTDDIGVQLELNSDNNFDMRIWRRNPLDEDALTEIEASPIEFSLISTVKNGYGQNIYLPNLLKNSLIFSSQINNSTVTTFVDDTAIAELAGGTRGDAITGAQLASAYDPFKDCIKYPANLFFDSSSESEVATVFETLRSSYQKFARFLLPTALLTATELLADTLGAKNNIDDRGISYYCLNWGLHKDIYFGNSFLCSNMGLISAKHAIIIEKGFGGHAPMWIDENDFGGQLGSNIEELINGAEEAQLKLLDEAQLNPVIEHPTYGFMIVSDRTTQIKLSDYSYIPHSGLADYIVHTIATQVLPYQIGKLINTSNMTKRKIQAESIIANVGGLLNDFYVLCDESNNTAVTKSQGKFVMTVGVQFTPFAETIEFNFINTPQGVSVEETITKS